VARQGWDGKGRFGFSVGAVARGTPAAAMSLVPPGSAARRPTAVVGALLLFGWLAALGPGTPAATASAPAANRKPAVSGARATRASASRTDDGRVPGRSPGRPSGRASGRSVGQATGPATGGTTTGGATARRAGAAASGVASAAGGPPKPGQPPALRFPLWPPSVAPPLSLAPTPGPGNAGPPVDCRRVKCIALTFDDGPGPYTARLLRMLAAAHVRATFFLIGRNIRGREAIVRQELAQGDVIGDHTWTHPDLSALSSSAIRSQLARTLAEIRRATGGGTPLMRPPYGATNHRVAAIARSMGFAQILWSVDTNDWRDRNSRIVAHRAVTWAHRNDIILMHDIHPTTVAAVPQILRGLARRGFTFVTVPELFGDRPLRPGGVYFNGPPVPAKKAPAAKAPAATATPTTDASANVAPGGGARPPSA
jgi:peptidoglycan/xylan/chitin deacetylase (PgdA/CDA1 family)